MQCRMRLWLETLRNSRSTSMSCSSGVSTICSRMLPESRSKKSAFATSRISSILARRRHFHRRLEASEALEDRSVFLLERLRDKHADALFHSPSCIPAELGAFLHESPRPSRQVQAEDDMSPCATYVDGGSVRLTAARNHLTARHASPMRTETQKPGHPRAHQARWRAASCVLGLGVRRSFRGQEWVHLERNPELMEESVAAQQARVSERASVSRGLSSSFFARCMAVLCRHLYLGCPHPSPACSRGDHGPRSAQLRRAGLQQN